MTDVINIKNQCAFIRTSNIEKQLFILKSETPNNLSIDPLYRIYDVCLKDMIFIKSFPFWIFVSILWIKTRQERNKITEKLSRALIDQDSHRANQWRLTWCPWIPWYTGHLNRYWQWQGVGVGRLRTVMTSDDLLCLQTTGPQV